jgi:putative hydrolase of the HAD superfamily
VIRALICDFGGVLTTPLFQGFAAYEEESGISVEHLGEAMGRAAAEHGEHPLFALERGEISEREFGARLAPHLDPAFDLARLREFYLQQLRPNPQMIDFVGELRGRGLRTALCTNNVREWEPFWRAKLPALDDIFDLVVDSAFVGVRKPERAIYELTLERLGDGLRPDECVFVDDLDVNCDTARELGMTAVLFERTEQAIADIEAALARGAGNAKKTRREPCA